MSGSARRLVLKVRCVLCGATREVAPGEVPTGDVPMCESCFSPMVPERAEAAS